MSEPTNIEKCRVVAERLGLWRPDSRLCSGVRAPDFTQPAEAWRLQVALRNEGARLYYCDWREVEHRIEIRFRTRGVDIVVVGTASTIEQALLDAAYQWAKGAESDA